MRATHWTYEKAKGDIWKRQADGCPITGALSDAIAGAVYVIISARQVIYVGETERGLIRVDDGFRQNSDQSIAYKWRSSTDLRDQVLLGVIFDSFSLDYNLSNKIDRQALEADVATLVYIRRGVWPRMLTAVTVHGGLARSDRHLEALAEISRYLVQNGYLPPA